MSDKLPPHVVKHYPDGARGFRSLKRKQLREIKKLVFALRFGCAYLPCGSDPVTEIERALDLIGDAISVKEWGR